MWPHFILIYEPYIAQLSISPASGINISMWNGMVRSTRCEIELPKTLQNRGLGNSAFTQ